MNKIISSLIIALGLLALGLCIKAGINSISENQRSVSVRGLAVRTVKADKVTWPIVYKLVGNDLPALYNNINSQNATVVKFLKDNGVTADEISVNAPSIYDQQADRYGNERITYRYNVTSVIVVTSNNVDKVQELIKRQTELLKDGIALSTDDYSYQTIFEFTGLNEIKPEMIAEATKNARAAAQKFADDSNSKLGKIKTAYQGQFTIDDRDSYTPDIKEVRVVTSVSYTLED